MNAPDTSPVDFDALPPVVRGSTWGAELWIAVSHLRSKKREAFVNVVTFLSILGVLVGVMTLNMVLSVMTGFEIDLRDKILGANSHLVVLRQGGGFVDGAGRAEEIGQIPGVSGSAPFVYAEAMLRSNWAASGVVLKGIDPDRTHAVTRLQDDLTWGMQGELTTAEQRTELFRAMKGKFQPPIAEEDDPGLPGVFIGKELRDTLQVRPGDVVQLINPLGGGTGPMGMPVPNIRPLRVVGVFDSGMFEYDTKWVYVENSVAQSFLKMGDNVTGVEVAVTDIDRVEDVAAAIQAQLRYPYYSRTWKDMNQALFKALKLEKIVMGLILGMIVVVAALLIVTTLTMLVITKGREIAILKAMGASKRGIMRIFVIEGVIIGLVGSVGGTIAGLIGCEVLRRIEWKLETDVYYLDTLPVVVDPATVLVTALGAFSLAFVATLYPAGRASVVDPVEGLRYE